MADSLPRLTDAELAECALGFAHPPAGIQEPGQARFIRLVRCMIMEIQERRSQDRILREEPPYRE